jgi:hypothetical protein
MTAAMLRSSWFISSLPWFGTFFLFAAAVMASLAIAIKPARLMDLSVVDLKQYQLMRQTTQLAGRGGESGTDSRLVIFNQAWLSGEPYRLVLSDNPLNEAALSALDPGLPIRVVYEKSDWNYVFQIEQAERVVLAYRDSANERWAVLRARLVEAAILCVLGASAIGYGRRASRRNLNEFSVS